MQSCNYRIDKGEKVGQYQNDKDIQISFTKEEILRRYLKRGGFNVVGGGDRYSTADYLLVDPFDNLLSVMDLKTSTRTREDYLKNWSEEFLINADKIENLLDIANQFKCKSHIIVLYADCKKFYLIELTKKVIDNLKIRDTKQGLKAF